MGTRHLTCVVYKNEFKVSQYGQWDGYPNGQGKTIAEFLTTGFKKRAFIKNLRTLKSLTPEEVKDLWEACGADGEWVNMEVADRFKQRNYHLSRDCGADILEMIQKGLISTVYLNTKFMYDSLFCEYCYIIDLDRDVLEVYRGFNKRRLKKSERFYKDTPDDDGYYAVRKIREFPIKDLTVEGFLKSLRRY